MSSGGGQNTVVQQSQPPAQFLQAYQDVLNRANTTLTNQPTYQPYQGNIVAGLSPDQQSAIGTIQNTQGIANPFINAAAQHIGASTAPVSPAVQPYSQQAMTALSGAQNAIQTGEEFTAAGGAPVTAANINAFENPFTQQVVGATEREFANQNAQQQQQVRSGAAAQGAFGGDREAVAEGITAGQQQLAEAPVISGLESQGFGQALQAAMQQKQLQQQAGQGLTAEGQATTGEAQGIAGIGNLNLGAEEANRWLESQAGYGMANLGQEAQGTALQQAQAQLGVGGLEQQVAQEELNVPYEQYTAGQAYPFQTTGWLGGIAEGLGTAAGGQSSTQYPGPNPISQAAGLGLTAAGIGNMAGLWGSGAPEGYTDTTSGFVARGGAIRRAGGGMMPHYLSPSGSVTRTNVPENPTADITGAVRLAGIGSKVGKMLGAGSEAPVEDTAPINVGAETAAGAEAGAGAEAAAGAGAATQGALDTSAAGAGLDTAATAAGTTAVDAAAADAATLAAIDAASTEAAGAGLAGLGTLAFAARGGRVPERAPGGIVIPHLNNITPFPRVHRSMLPANSNFAPHAFEPRRMAAGGINVPQLPTGDTSLSINSNGGISIPQLPTSPRGGSGMDAVNKYLQANNPGPITPAAGPPTSNPPPSPQPSAPPNPVGSAAPGNPVGSWNISGVKGVPDKSTLNLVQQPGIGPHDAAYTLKGPDGSILGSYTQTGDAITGPSMQSLWQGTTQPTPLSYVGGAGPGIGAPQPEADHGARGGIIKRGPGGDIPGEGMPADWSTLELPPGGSGPPLGGITINPESTADWHDVGAEEARDPWAGLQLAGAPGSAPELSMPYTGTGSAPRAPVSPSSSSNRPRDMLDEVAASRSGIATHPPLAPGSASPSGEQTGQPSAAPGGQPKHNWGETLVAMGLGMMAGTSPHALTNIGQGGLQGLKFDEAQRAREENASLRRLQQEQLGQYHQDIIGARAATADIARQHLAQQGAQHADQQTIELTRLAQRQQELNQGKYKFEPWSQPDPNDPSKTVSGLMQTDPTGREPPRFVPTTGVPMNKADPMAAQFGNVANAPADLHGEDYLKTLDPKLATQIRAYAEGRMPFPTGFALSKPYWQNMVQAISQYDPSFDAVNYGTRAATRKDFASGKAGTSVTALNTVMGHVASLKDAGDALKNSNYPMANSIINWIGTNTGHPEVNNFKLASGAVASELERAFRGNAGALAGIQEWRSSLSANASPEQQAGAWKKLGELLDSRIDALGDQYSRGMGRTVDGLTLLAPHAQAAYEKVTGRKPEIPVYNQRGIRFWEPEQQGQGATASPSFVEGKQYVDANGNKAIYRDGKFEPVQ